MTIDLTTYIPSEVPICRFSKRRTRNLRNPFFCFKRNSKSIKRKFENSRNTDSDFTVRRRRSAASVKASKMSAEISAMEFPGCRIRSCPSRRNWQPSCSSIDLVKIILFRLKLSREHITTYNMARSHYCVWSTVDSCTSAGRYKISYPCIDAVHCGKCRPMCLV